MNRAEMLEHDPSLREPDCEPHEIGTWTFMVSSTVPESPGVRGENQSEQEYEAVENALAELETYIEQTWPGWMRVEVEET